jgi:hypothetical protein
MKTAGLVLFFATAGFFLACFLLFVFLPESGGHGPPVDACVGACLGIPLGTAAGGVFGYILAQKLWG